MPSRDTLVEAKHAPPLNVPASSATATIRIIDTTSFVYMDDQSLMFQPKILPDNSVNCPAFSFLVSSPIGEHVLFDIGVRKDPENYPPTLYNRLKEKFEFGAKYNVSEILDMHAPTTGIPAKDISAIIYSHHHFDHIGDLSTFPNATLVVGPGFLAENTPAYPENPDGVIFTSDLTSRQVKELKASPGLQIGRCDAHDYFGDGSFYLLATPGHTDSHICGLVRVGADSFVLMGGDACHNMGEMRPNEYYPLPSTIVPSPSTRFPHGCPGAIVQELLPKKAANRSMYDPTPRFNKDNEEAIRSTEKLVEVDAGGKVLVALAHDVALLGQIPFFPESIKGEEVEALDEKTRWCFLGPLAQLLDKVES